MRRDLAVSRKRSRGVAVGAVAYGWVLAPGAESFGVTLLECGRGALEEVLRTARALQARDVAAAP